jgi:hypothetical protein
MTTLARPLTLRGQINWRWTCLAQWLEELPPFWAAYAMTLTETVGASILALPIALAGIGPIAGVILWRTQPKPCCGATRQAILYCRAT